MLLRLEGAEPLVSASGASGIGALRLGTGVGVSGSRGFRAQEVSNRGSESGLGLVSHTLGESGTVGTGV